MAGEEVDAEVKDGDRVGVDQLAVVLVGRREDFERIVAWLEAPNLPEPRHVVVCAVSARYREIRDDGPLSVAKKDASSSSYWISASSIRFIASKQSASASFCVKKVQKFHPGSWR